MGQKVNPHGLRVGVIKDWDSRWFARKDTFGDTLAVSYTHLDVYKRQPLPRRLSLPTALSLMQMVSR